MSTKEQAELVKSGLFDSEASNKPIDRTLTLNIRIKKIIRQPEAVLTPAVLSPVSPFDAPLNKPGLDGPLLNLTTKSGITFKVIDNPVKKPIKLIQKKTEEPYVDGGTQPPLTNNNTNTNTNTNNTNTNSPLKPIKQIKIKEKVHPAPTYDTNFDYETSEYDLLSEDLTTDIGYDEFDVDIPEEIEDDTKIMVRKLRIFGKYFWVGCDKPYIYDPDTLVKVGIIKPNLEVDFFTS